MQERCNSIANALELCLSCTKPSKWNEDRFHSNTFGDQIQPLLIFRFTGWLCYVDFHVMWKCTRFVLLQDGGILLWIPGTLLYSWTCWTIVQKKPRRRNVQRLGNGPVQIWVHWGTVRFWPCPTSWMRISIVVWCIPLVSWPVVINK